MTDDELKAIHKQVARAQQLIHDHPSLEGWVLLYCQHMPLVLAEVERLREIVHTVAAELDEMASALDIDMPSDSGYVERVERLARTLRGGA